MEVIMSGQGGLFASIKPPMLYKLDEASPTPIKSYNFGLAFSGCTDVQRIRVETLAQARQACEFEWACDRLLRSVLFLLDQDEALEDRIEFADCAEELISEHKLPLEKFLIARLSINPMPAVADLGILEQIRSSSPRTVAIVEEIIRDQKIIAQVSEALRLALQNVLEDVDQRQSLLNRLMGVGAPRGIVEAIRANANIDMFVLKLIAQFRQVDGAREVIEAWTASMRTRRKVFLPLLPDTSEEDHDLDDLSSGVGGRRAFEQTMKQLAAIVVRLKERDLEGARRFAEALVQSQRISSGPEHIGKSLSNLAQQAKELGVPELQIEWAEKAVAENSADPISFSHLIDALISAFRFNEAEVAIRSMESLGASLAGANARARLLRATGKFEEARATFLKAAADHPYDETVFHSLQGAAEVLRDMNRYEEALEEYQKLTESYPLEGALWAGRASVLMDLGRFDDAITTFNISEKRGSGSVPLNGRASAYKRRGDLTQALKLYNDVVREFPHDPVALCGRAEVYKDQGNLERALADFRAAALCSPYIPGPVVGVVEVLKELRRFGEASALLEDAIARYPLHAGIASLRADLLARRSALAEALAAYDQLISQFPFHTHARKKRADVLRRMGQREAALQVYDSIIIGTPHYGAAKLAKISLLIELGRCDEAMELFPVGPPRTENDWRFYFLRALAFDALGGAKKSEPHFRHGAFKAPFARQRRLFAAAWGRTKLIKNEFATSLKVIHAIPGEVSNVILLHALAGAGDKKRAKSTYDEIVSTESSATIIELSRAIVARFSIVDGVRSDKSREWILESERTELLLEVAA
jgi:tetratricopeptide (TPR) repeat protein